MAELDFERRLERLFAQSTPFPDEVEFARSVEARLDRGWNLRRWLIGAAGFSGGIVGASQLILSNFAHRVEDVSQGSSKLIQAGVSQLRPGVSLLGLLSTDWIIIWVASGLAVVAMGFVLTRVIEEI
ncbi:MAG: hypothetical protein CGW95_11305 [Phenylobacterium zucineum]|nr:MAG: hypothetical protein CGW95_11305 [Phenylobacterium zucineum]